MGRGFIINEGIHRDNIDMSNNNKLNDKDIVYTYIVQCADGSLYTGWTYDLEKRIESHNAGKGAKYTRSRLPVKLVYYESCKDKIAAMKREYAIKQLERKDKLKLIEEFKNSDIM